MSSQGLAHYHAVHHAGLSIFKTLRGCPNTTPISPAQVMLPKSSTGFTQQRGTLDVVPA